MSLAQHNMHEVLHINQKLLRLLNCCKMSTLSERSVIFVIFKACTTYAFVLPIENKSSLFLDNTLRPSHQLVLEPGISERLVKERERGNIVAQERVAIRVNATRQGVRQPVKSDSSQDMVCI